MNCHATNCDKQCEYYYYYRILNCILLLKSNYVVCQQQKYIARIDQHTRKILLLHTYIIDRK